jgi:hypothetical protein
VSANPDADALEQKRRQINRLIQEIEQLSESQVGVPEFFAEFLQRVLTAIAAPAGAAWVRTAQGHLQLLHHINFGQVQAELDKSENGQASHSELLRQTVQQARPRLVPPRSGGGPDGQGGANLTPYVVLIAPILIEGQVSGLVEVWQDPDRPPQAMRGFLQFITDMAEIASRFLRNTQLRQMQGQQQLWTQLEAYSRLIHNSMIPREVCYNIANEGRRLIQCDRVSVAIRQGSSTRVEAISGADVIEKRSSLVQNMRALFDAVIVWGEKLVYSGTKDDSLPPKVLHALDKYLEEANSKLLIITPMQDEREKELKRPARSAMLAECFEPMSTVDQIAGRMDVVVKHASAAVYNAVELRRLPFRWLLQPLANVKDSLRGNRLAIAGAILGGLMIVGAALAVIPYPLRMEAKGQLMPKIRQTVYSPIAGQIVRVSIKNRQEVRKGDELFKVRNTDLQDKVNQALGEKRHQEGLLKYYQEQLEKTSELQARDEISLKILSTRFERDKALDRLRILEEQSPNPMASSLRAPQDGMVITFDPNDRLLSREVTPSDPLIQIADLKSDWEIELRIPESHVGHIREAIEQSKDGRLEVDILIASHPESRRFKGSLSLADLAGAVEMHENEANLLARVQLVDMTRDELDKMSVGTDIKAKIRCGNRPVGYVWFHELWEFFYEKVLF